MAEINPHHAFDIADMIAGASVDATRMGRASRDAACAAGNELNEIPKGGPRGKMAKVANEAESLEQIQKFEGFGKQGQCTAELRFESEVSCVRNQATEILLRVVRKTTFPANRRSGAGAAGLFCRRETVSDVFAAPGKRAHFARSRSQLENPRGGPGRESVGTCRRQITRTETGCLQGGVWEDCE